MVMSHHSDEESFKTYKKIWDLKISKIKDKYPIDILFLYSDSNIEEKYKVGGYNLISKCEENYWGSLLTKAINGIEYFQENDYDLVFKTNLSTFINVPTFYDYCNKIPNEREYVYDGIFGGYEGFNFVSGAGILLNKKCSQIILNNQNLITEKWTDDIFFGYVLNKLNKIEPNSGGLNRYDLIQPDMFFNLPIVKNYSHIRVKVRKGEWDSFYFNKLYDLIFNETENK